MVIERRYTEHITMPSIRVIAGIKRIHIMSRKVYMSYVYKNTDNL